MKGIFSKFTGSFLFNSLISEISHLQSTQTATFNTYSEKLGGLPDPLHLWVVYFGEPAG